MKSKILSAAGIAAAIMIVLAGVFIPKLLLKSLEESYEREQILAWRSALSADPTPTPSSGNSGTINKRWLSEARTLLENESSLVLRDPTDIELSMEQAAATVRRELDVLIEDGAMPDLELDEYSFKHGLLKGYDPASVPRFAENGPVGLWILSFEALNGYSINVTCDSRNGSVYSVTYDWTAAFIDEECCTMLVSYANYLGLSVENGIFFEVRDSSGFLYVNEFKLHVDTGLPHSMRLWIESEGVYPTPLPTPTPVITEIPVITPTPDPSPKPTPTPEP